MEGDSLLRDLWVRGEVSNLSNSGAGHFYFTLKDPNSQVRCVMFRPAHGSDHLSNGGAVLTHGRVSLYELRGELQLYVDLVQPEGIGELALEMERLRVKLEGEGLFLESRKRSIPPFPQRIGVVTSPSGSVWHDIQNVVGRRYPLVELSLVPTPVQGERAIPGIVEAFEVLNREEDIDLVILARGGGSLEELLPFNEEAVARAIYASNVPVISAIGHETDYTIADMVADCRAPTPSAAAELAVPDCHDLEEYMHSFSMRLFRRVSADLASYIQDIDQMIWRLERHIPDIPTWRQRIDDLSHTYTITLQSYISLRIERLEALVLRLSSLNPRGVLARGYSVVERRGTAVLVTSVDDVRPGDEVDITVKDGSFSGQVLTGHAGDTFR